MTLKIVHKRSNATDASDQAVPPAPTDLEQGEIAINYSEEDPTLFIKDEAGNVVRVVGSGGGSSVATDVLAGDGITVTPDANNEKVTIAADPNGDKGIEIHSGKIAAKPSATEGIAFNGSGELAAQIDTNKGLEFDSGNIAAKAGAAISFDAGGQIQADVDTTKGVEISGDQIATKLGTGLAFDGDGKIAANIGDGISIGGGGEIIADVAGVIGGKGITSTKDASNDFTIDADINTNKGLEFDGDQIAVKIGANLTFNGITGAIDSSFDALTYKGVIDLTADGNVPATPAIGDTYANTADGTISSDWQTATGEVAGTPVVPGDLIAWNGTKWTYVPTGGTTGAPNFWQLAGSELSPVENTYDVSIGGGKNIIKADGSSQFANGNLAIETTGELDIGNGGHKLFANGSAFFSNAKIEFSTGGGVSIGAGSEISFFNGDGTFRGDVVVQNPGKTAYTGVYKGQLYVHPDSANSSSPALITTYEGAGKNTSTIYADGNAEFDGKIKSASTAAGDSGTTLVTKDYLTSTGGGGTGTFGYWNRTGTNLNPANSADNVHIGTNVDESLGNGVAISSAGKLTVARTGGSTEIFRGKEATSADPTSRIFADGSAEFKGTQTLKIRPTLSDSSSGFALALFASDNSTAQFSVAADGSSQINNTIFLNSNGSIVTSGANDDSYILQGKKGAAKNIELFASGNANFSGSVTSDTTGTYNFQAASSGTTYAALYASDQTLKMGDLAKSEYTIQLNASNGSGTFTGTHTAKTHFSVIPAAVSNPSNYSAFLVDYEGNQTAKITANGNGSFKKVGINYSSTLNLPLTVGGSGEVAAFTDSKGAAININLNAGGVSEIASNGSTSTLELTCNGNKNITLNNNGTTFFGGKATMPSTTAADGGTTLATKDYVDANGGGGGGGAYNGANAWGVVQGGGGLVEGLNCTSTRNSTGNYTITFTNPMPSDNYAITTGNLQAKSIVEIVSQDANGFNYLRKSPDTGTPTDLKTAFAVHATNAAAPRGGTGTDAWANVQSNGTIRSSFNISAVTRNETGRYQVNFINPMPDTNYGISTSIMSAAPGTTYPANMTTTGFLLCVDNAAGTGAQDLDFSFQVNATNALLPDSVTQDQLDAAVNSYGARIIAWGRCQGTTLLDGQNIASITQDGGNNYRKRVRFTVPPSNANYCIIATINGSDDQYQFISAHPNSNEQFTIVTRDSDGSERNRDSSFIVMSTESLALPVTTTTGDLSYLARLEARIAQLEADHANLMNDNGSSSAY